MRVRVRLRVRVRACVCVCFGAYVPHLLYPLVNAMDTWAAPLSWLL